MATSNYKLITNTKHKGGFKRQVRKLLKFLFCLLFIAIIPILLYEMVIAKREDEVANLFTNYRGKKIQNYSNPLTDMPTEIKHLPLVIETNQIENLFNFEDKDSTSSLDNNDLSSSSVTSIKKVTTSVVRNEQNKLETVNQTTNITPSKIIAPNGTINQSHQIYKEAENTTMLRWCGFGSQLLPSGVDQIEETGKCCQEHLECSQKIGIGETKHELHNNGIFTLSHCSCEDKFYKCLKELDAVVPNLVGFTYFTVFGSKCFKEEHPVIRCTQKSLTVYAFKKKNNVRCVEYSFDADSPKNYSLFDLPVYTF